MKYLKLFETESQYENYINGGGVTLPNVSLCEDNNKVYYNPIVPETKLIVYYDIQDISSPTTICTNYDSSIKSIEVDGTLLDSIVTTYQFNSVGEHVIKYEFNNPTSVGNNAPLFMGITTIKRAVIADTFTSIGTYAFGNCSGLTSVTIGNGVTSIGDAAFASCSSLASVTIPNSVTSINNSAFANCTSLTSITIGSGVTNIGISAFYNCSSLTEITSLAITAPTIQSDTFPYIKTGGALTVPQGSSGYDTWMQNTTYYLGLYGWTKTEQ